MLRSIIGTLVVTAATAFRCDAAVIVAWNLAGEPGDQAFTAPSEEALLTTGFDVTRGPGLNPSAAGDSISSNGWDTLNPDDDYFTFGFSVDPGYWVTLDELRIGTRSSNTGPGDLGLFYNGDSFTSNLFTFTQSGTDFLDSVADLSALTNLTGNVEFRIVALSDTRADGDTGITSAGTFRLTNFFDDGNDTGSFQITGSVTAVPEPSSLVVMGLILGGGYAGRYFRNRRRAV